MGWWAAAGIVLQAAGMGADAQAGKAASRAEHQTAKATKMQWQEDYRTMTQDEQAALGTQTARYAGSGVDVGVGSPSTILQQTRDEYHRAVAAEAFQIRQRLRGAQAQGQAARYAQVGGYFSSLAGIANTVAQYQYNKPTGANTG